MKLISADDVIKAVDKHTFETKDGLCLDDDISIILEDVPTVEERKWIPCSERLPEEEIDFLVTDGESMAVGYYRQDAKAWDSADFGWIENREKGYGINEVIAWMPLPEPYAERREE